MICLTGKWPDLIHFEHHYNCFAIFLNVLPDWLFKQTTVSYCNVTERQRLQERVREAGWEWDLIGILGTEGEGVGVARREFFKGPIL